MEPITLRGEPFVIQSTEAHGMLISWTGPAVKRGDDEIGESISFTVLVPESPHLSLVEIQRYALKRAAELLQEGIRQYARENDDAP